MTEPKRLLRGEGTAFERSLLQAGEAEEVPPEVRIKMAAALGIGVASLPPPPVADVGSGAAGSKLALAGLLKIGAGVVLVGGLVAGALTWGGSEPAVKVTDTRPAELADSPQTQDDVAGESEKAPQAEVLTVDQLEKAEQAEADEPMPAAEVRRSTKSAAKVELERRSAGDVAAEVKLLDSVRGAIARGDHAAARRLLAQYDARFPRGVLRREAKVLRRAADAASAD